ncbi:Radical SAM domain protein [Methylorubrum populi BJ001]|uniref:Radical SAM domain protein n=1 Tax=Methylorubrum populi (strain ATCC BAA-705 / NCIMB 13946 / BJ001) TaxID=441620 RepID=B1ZHH0_METPB|nr:PA0069 family radical SAM protein [Methylorubrum populi]ACB79906.1 Radical SAM domain protein [Methylorubrum populi BJ001]PZP72048.1 MAG: radical SAM protein [Methylorubrum populi]
MARGSGVGEERTPPRGRMEGARIAPEARRGRGATANPDGRFEATRREGFDDGWPEEVAGARRTDVTPERARHIITRNASPDISFDRSINPYRGCEHGCIYCFARPNHGYVGLSPGLDFETRLFAKPDAAALLERELSAPGYRPRTIALGTATDPYQPIERSHGLTRSVLEVLARFRHPVGIVTKSNLILRDRDLLAAMAAQDLVKVAISVTTLDPDLARRMEPRAPHPRKRLEAIRALSEAGVPVMVLTAPVIPSLNDHEIEAILEAARAAGAREAGYVLLRLPHELDDLVGDWFTEHYPGRKAHVFSLLSGARGGKTYDAAFGTRMIGQGPYADLIRSRFALAKRRLGYSDEPLRQTTALFRRPEAAGDQLALF